MAMAFHAIDVETANADPSSICEIGIVHSCGVVVRAAWSTLVDPGVTFNPEHTALHGIDAQAVRSAPTIPQLYESLARLLRATVVVSHTDFDRVALDGVLRRHGLPAIAVQWRDSAAVARRAWPSPRITGGWSLAVLAARLGIAFRHHLAVDDARVAAEIVLRAHREAGPDPGIERPPGGRAPPDVRRQCLRAASGRHRSPLSPASEATHEAQLRRGPSGRDLREATAAWGPETRGDKREADR